MPSGASHVTSSEFEALARPPRSGSAMTQSSLHHPGSFEASAHEREASAPPARYAISPPSTSAAVHDTGEPARICASPMAASTGHVPNLTSCRRNPGPRRVAVTLSRMTVGEQVARRLAGRGADVDALEEVGIGGEPMDAALRRRARQRQRREDVGRPILEADDPRHAPEADDAGVVDIGHRHPMAIDPGVDVDDEGAAGLARHRRDPGSCLIRVELHPEVTRRGQDRGDRVRRRLGTCLSVRCHRRGQYTVGRRVFSSA